MLSLSFSLLFEGLLLGKRFGNESQTAGQTGEVSIQVTVGQRRENAVCGWDCRRAEVKRSKAPKTQR